MDTDCLMKLDQAVQLLLEKCSKLAQIDLANCVQITIKMRTQCDEKLFKAPPETGAACILISFPYRLPSTAI